ncbi:MAG: membrane protein [Hungatella sp.]|nr:membrane protein [Hungatella sp.]
MESKKKDLALCVVLVVAANLILGGGIAVLRLSGFGTDPFTCMNLGVSSILGLGLGAYQVILNIILFIPVFILDRKSFGVGALVNMLALGYFVEFFMFLFSAAGVTIEGLAGSLGVRVFLLAAGVLVVCFGISLYMFCDLGAAPYDRLGVIIENYSHGKIKFRAARICMDLVSIAVGFLTGSIVGLGTIVVGFFTGPIVSFFRERAVAPMVKKMGIQV